MPRKFDHLIVLMLENRSFDHMLGFLRHPSSEFPGLNPDIHNNRVEMSAEPVPVDTSAAYEIVSPHHNHLGVMQQLFGDPAVKDFGRKWRPRKQYPGPGPSRTNQGFVREYSFKKGHEDPGNVMRCFDEDSLPVLSQLAKQYAVCTRWFSSLPGETWPNRGFALAGTSHGLVDIQFTKTLLRNRKTEPIFDKLRQARKSWRIYHKDVPHPMVYLRMLRRNRRRHFQSYEQLKNAIKHDTLPDLAWIEPDYGLPGYGNSQHPGQADSAIEFLAGEKLISDIHNELVRSMRKTVGAGRDPAESVFARTLFLITYDEHGGFYDRERPPEAPPPDDRTYSAPESDYVFSFDLLGARVPAVVISPWVEEAKITDTVFDHTSILATIRSNFSTVTHPIEPLGARDKWARGLHDILGSTLRTDLPETTPKRVPSPSGESKAHHQLVQSQLWLIQEVGEALTREKKTGTLSFPRVSSFANIDTQLHADDFWEELVRKILKRFFKSGMPLVELRDHLFDTRLNPGGKAIKKVVAALLDHGSSDETLRALDDEGRYLKLSGSGRLELNECDGSDVLIRKVKKTKVASRLFRWFRKGRLPEIRRAMDKMPRDGG